MTNFYYSRCGKSDKDLKPLCTNCETEIADAEFPFDEYCEECAKEIKEEQQKG